MLTATKKTIEISVEINASPETVWHTMLDQETFQDWCSAFMPGSHYVGEWTEGSIIRFLGPGENGTVGGMVTKLVEVNPFKTVRAEHIGVVHEGKDVFEGPQYDEWIPCIEEYHFKPTTNGTHLNVVTTVPEQYYDMFTKSWETALSRLKTLAESA